MHRKPVVIQPALLAIGAVFLELDLNAVIGRRRFIEASGYKRGHQKKD
jgi:hypothetical protein